MSAITVGRSPRVLASSGTPASVTGTTTETQLAAVAVPAGLLGSNGMLRVSTLWTMTNNGNAKTPRVRFSGAAGAQFVGGAVTGVSQVHDVRLIYANNATNAEKAFNSGTATPYTSNGASPTTASADTTQATSLFLSGQLAVGSDTLTLEAFTVEFVPSA